MIELAPEIATHLGDGPAAFERVFALTGKVFRHVDGRQTLRVEIGGETYFLKRHQGYGWKRIVRSLFAGRWPVLSARTELNAIRRFNEVGIPTVDVVGFGERGRNPATRQSFLLMRPLTGFRDLEKIGREWPEQPPSPTFRQELIDAVAATTKRMHDAGVNHRDYYVCHLWLDLSSIRASDRRQIANARIPDKFADDPQTQIAGDGLRDAAQLPVTRSDATIGCLTASRTHSRSADCLPKDRSPHLCVIDLHRAMQRRRVPTFWLIKDLAGLLFSAWEYGLTKSDCVRFVRGYRGRPARDVFADERWIWRIVIWRATQLFRKTHRCEPPTLFVIPQVARRAVERHRATRDLKAFNPSVRRAA